LRQVFTHASWVSERGQSYERLEFLGDSVLSLAVTTELYRRFPEHSEGHLARLRAYIVSRATCAKVARALGLPKYLGEVGAGHDVAEGEQLVDNQNVLADVTESLIGALYITFGFDVVRPAIVEAFGEHIEFAQRSYIDFKTELQELLAKNGRHVAYEVAGYSGPPHERHFAVEAVVEGEVLGRGRGPTKKSAEQDAAAEALTELRNRERRQARRVRLLGPRKRGAPSAVPQEVSAVGAVAPVGAATSGVAASSVEKVAEPFGETAGEPVAGTAVAGEAAGTRPVAGQAVGRAVTGEAVSGAMTGEGEELTEAGGRRRSKTARASAADQSGAGKETVAGEASTDLDVAGGSPGVARQPEDT
jgi:ribonuclease-3